MARALGRSRRRLRRGMHRFNDLYVAGAAANVAGKRSFDFLFVRPGIAPQQRLCRHDHTGRAKATLGPELFMKGALQAVGTVLRRQAFDCFDRLSVAPQREHETGWHGFFVDQHGASTTFASIATDLRACEAHDLAQVIDQKLVFGDGIVAPSAIEPQMYELFPSGLRLLLRHDLAAIATVLLAKAFFARGAMTKIKSWRSLS